MKNKAFEEHYFLGGENLFKDNDVINFEKLFEAESLPDFFELLKVISVNIYSINERLKNIEDKLRLKPHFKRSASISDFKTFVHSNRDSNVNKKMGIIPSLKKDNGHEHVFHCNIHHNLNNKEQDDHFSKLSDKTLKFTNSEKLKGKSHQKNLVNTIKDKDSSLLSHLSNFKTTEVPIDTKDLHQCVNILQVSIEKQLYMSQVISDLVCSNETLLKFFEDHLIRVSGLTYEADSEDEVKPLNENELADRSSSSGVDSVQTRRVNSSPSDNCYKDSHQRPSFQFFSKPSELLSFLAPSINALNLKTRKALSLASKLNSFGNKNHRKYKKTTALVEELDENPSFNDTLNHRNTELSEQSPETLSDGDNSKPEDLPESTFYRSLSSLYNKKRPFKPFEKITKKRIQDQKERSHVVFVPGVKASILLDPCNNNFKAWVDGKHLIHNSEYPSIRLPLEFDQFGFQLKDNLVPGGVFHHINIVGGLKVPIYSPGIKYLRKKGFRVHEFSYDWRRSNNETSLKLEAFIEQIAHETRRPVQLVCHSMGSMVGFVVMKRRPELVHSALFLAPPFNLESPLFLLKHRDGHPMGLNKKLLSARTHFSWLCSYCSYPLSGRGIIDVNGQMLHFDYYNPETWVKEKWGLFHPDHPETVAGTLDYENYWVKNFLKLALADGLQFLKELHEGNDKISLPPIAIIAATGYETIKYLMKDGPKSIRGLDSVTPKLTKEGDDLLPIDFTYLPGSIKHARFLSKKSHTFIVQDISVIKEALRYLNSCREGVDSPYIFPYREPDADADANEKENDFQAVIDNVDFSNNLSLKDFEGCL